MSESHNIDVILVEDEPDLRDILVTSLTYFGLHMRGVGNAVDLDREFLSRPAAILLLDLTLPGENGNAIATRYRAAHPGIGIVMLTAQGDRDSRVRGYAGGADQYFVKPVDHEELATALKNLSHRLTPQAARWTVDLPHSTLIAPDGTQTALTHNEALILGCLAEGAGAVIQRARLYRATNDPDNDYAAQRLETALSRLRAKARRNGLPPLPIKARHGAGYAFADKVRVLRAP